MQPIIKSINDQFNAQHLFKKQLVEQGYVLLSEHWENYDRDCFITTAHNGQIERFYFKFKKAFFMKFGEIFPQEKGLGDSINIDLLNNLLNKNTDYLIFSYSSGTYFVRPLQILKYCTSRGLIYTQNKANFYNKADFSGQKKEVHEKVYCFPLELLTNTKYLSNPF